MRDVHPPVADRDVRDFCEWLLLQLEGIEDAEASYESSTGNPLREEDRELFDEACASDDPGTRKLLDLAFAEGASRSVFPLCRHVEEFLDSHGLREEPEPREPEDPAKVVVFDPSRVRKPEGEEGEGATAPGEDAA